MSLINSIIDYLACPNDGQNLNSFKKKLVCQFCESEFNILNENTIELVPKEKFFLKSNQAKNLYLKYYDDLTTSGVPSDPKKKHWGLVSKSIPEGFVIKSRQIIDGFLDSKIICDVGAGMGDYSLHFAKKCDLVIHCDLDINAINEARHYAKEQNLKNIIFIRCDYFSLPFKMGSLPFVTCIDVFERGEEHDSKLIQEIYEKLKKNGTLIADFHSKERSRFTHVENFGDRYSKDEIIAFFSKLDLNIYKIIGIGYLPQLANFSTRVYKIGNSICSIFLPPARWLVAGQKT